MNSKRLLKNVLILFCLLAGGLALAQAGDFKVSKVVEIGPADWVPFEGPAKWSPDGTKISYFSKGYLMITDTLGNSRQVLKVDMRPHRYEWVSSDEIAVTFMGRNEGGAIPYRLSLINLESGTETVLESFVRNGSGDSVNVTDFNGPFKTIDGDVYYLIAKSPLRGAHDYQRYKPSSVTTVLITSRLKSITNHVPSLSSSYFLRWGSDGLYSVRGNIVDSTRIAGKPYQNMPIAPEMSPDKRYIIVGGTMQRLADSVYIVLDTMIKQYPPKTSQCGIIFSSFSQTDSEVLFEIDCDDDKSYEATEVAVYNYGTGNFVVLDSLVGLTNCTTPAFSPATSDIILLSNYKLYLIKRGAR